MVRAFFLLLCHGAMLKCPLLCPARTLGILLFAMQIEQGTARRRCRRRCGQQQQLWPRRIARNLMETVESSDVPHCYWKECVRAVQHMRHECIAVAAAAAACWACTGEEYVQAHFTSNSESLIKPKQSKSRRQFAGTGLQACAAYGTAGQSLASQPVCGKSTLSIYQHLLYAVSQRKCFYLGDERDAQSQDVQFKDGVSHPLVRACLKVTPSRVREPLAVCKSRGWPAFQH